MRPHAAARGETCFAHVRSFTKKEKVVDIGPVEINKQEKKTIAWPDYAAGIAVLAGVVILVADRKKIA